VLQRDKNHCCTAHNSTLCVKKYNDFIGLLVNSVGNETGKNGNRYSGNEDKFRYKCECEREFGWKGIVGVGNLEYITKSVLLSRPY